MDITLARESCRTLLIIQGDGVQEGSYEDLMLGNAQSEALLPFSVQYEDAAGVYRYDVTGLLSYQDFTAQRSLPYDMLRRLLMSITEMSSAVDEYLLDPDSVLLDPAYIFTDPEMQQVRFAYVPGYHHDFADGLRELAGDLLERVDYDDRQCVFLVYELYRMVKSPGFHLSQLKSLPALARAAEAEIRLQQEETDEKQAAGEETEKADAADEKAPWIEEEETETQTQENLFEGLFQNAKGKKETDIMPHHFSVPLAVTGLCLLMLIFYNTGVMDKAVRVAGLTVGAQVLTVVLMAASCLFIFLLRKIRAGLSGRRMHGEETNEFWGDLLKGNYAYDEAEDEPVKRSLHRN